MPSARKRNEDIEGCLEEELSQYATEADNAAYRVVQGRTISEVNGALVAIPLDIIPLNVALPCTLYIDFQGRFLLFRRQGERLTTRRGLELIGKGVSTLYIHKAFWRIFLEALETMKLPQPVSPEAAATHMRHLLVAYGQELERKIKQPKRPMFEKIRQMGETLAVKIHDDPALGAALLRRSADSVQYFVNHSVNVAIYATLMGRKLGFSVPDQKLLFFAGLVHDIGDLFIPKSVLYKPSHLSPDEMDLVKSHTQKGAELLFSMNTPGSVIRTALQHHERVDGAGYPKGSHRPEINPFAKIISIADVYDALTNNRPYEPGMTPDAAVKTMRRLDGKFEPTYLSMVAPDAENKKAS